MSRWNRESNKNTIWRIFKPNSKKQQELKNLLANSNEIWISKENEPVVMDCQNQIQSQLVQVQTSGTNTLYMKTYYSMTNLETHCTSLSNSSYLKQSTIEIDSNTNKEFSHRDSVYFSQKEMVVTQVQQNNSMLTINQQEKFSDLDNNKTNTHITDFETLLQEKKDQEVSIQNSN
ncbi:28098_t:CDS:2, partial [Gigaspora margarita]